jgi:hypothetical protein
VLDYIGEEVNPTPRFSAGWNDVFGVVVITGVWLFGGIENHPGSLM